MHNNQCPTNISVCNYKNANHNRFTYRKSSAELFSFQHQQAKAEHGLLDLQQYSWLIWKGRDR